MRKSCRLSLLHKPFRTFWRTMLSLVFIIPVRNTYYDEQQTLLQLLLEFQDRLCQSYYQQELLIPVRSKIYMYEYIILENKKKWDLCFLTNNNCFILTKVSPFWFTLGDAYSSISLSQSGKQSKVGWLDTS